MPATQATAPSQTGELPVYDSATTASALVSQARALWSHRRLLRLLVARDVALRYKRSLLGVWWTMLNPLITMLVMWVVFSQLFHAHALGAPFIVYLLSGLVVVIFFQQTIVAVSNSIVQSAPILTKINVPGGVFAFAAAIAGAFNAVIMLVLLLIIEVGAGVTLSWRLALVPVPLLLLTAFIAGVGLIVASSAIRFHDTLHLTEVGAWLFGFLTPTFYPESIVRRAHFVLDLNPLYHFARVFRTLLHGGGVPASVGNWSVVVGASLVALALGAWLFARGWRAAVVTL